MGTEVQRKALALLKERGIGLTSKMIFDALGLEIKRERVNQALTELLKDDLVSGDGCRPQTYFFGRDGHFSSAPKRVPYEPVYVYPKNRHERFEWTRETYVPPPPPALRHGAMNFKRCQSVGTP